MALTLHHQVDEWDEEIGSQEAGDEDEEGEEGVDGVDGADGDVEMEEVPAPASITRNSKLVGPPSTNILAPAG